MPRRPHLGPGNDNIVEAKGLVDAQDPTNADGSPKFINDATGTWSLINPNGFTEREDILTNGTIIASGNAIPVGSGGRYRCELGNSISILSTLGYYTSRS